MSASKLAICAIVSTVFIFLLDYLFYGMLMVDTFQYCCQKEMPDMLWIILGLLIFSVMFCHIYAKGVESDNKTQEGIRFGIVVALFVWIPMGFIWYSLMDSEQCGPLSQYLIDMVFRLVQMILLGIIVAHVSGVQLKDKGKEDELPRLPPDPPDTGGGPTQGGGG